MEKKLSDITSKPVSARVCELLHEISTSRPEIDGSDHLVPLTHHDVASLIGAARQTTTTVLNALDGTSLGSISVGRGPIGLAVSGKNVWVTNSGGNSVTKR